MPREEHTLYDDFEYKGYWWLPDNPDKRIGGIVSYNGRRGTELLLFGWLGHVPPPIHSSSPDPPFFPVIHGYTADGTACSLLNCRVAEIPWNSTSGLTTATYGAEFLIIGQHTTLKIGFVEGKLRYTNLEEWVGHIPFTTNGKGTISDDPFTIPMSYTFPQSFQIDIPTHRMSIESDFCLQNRGGGFRSLTQNHIAYLKLIPKQIQSADWYVKRTIEIQRLLSLLAGHLVYPKEITLRAANQNEGSVSSKSVDVRLYFHVLNAEDTLSCHPKLMTAPLPEIRGAVQTVFQSWFSKLERMTNVSNLFFGAILNTQLYLENKYLSFVQAIECYSRCFLRSQYMDDLAFSTIYQTLVSAIPENTSTDLRTSLKKGRLLYANEYSLRRRLKEIFRLLEGETVDLVCTKQNAFCDRITDTRNYFTHYTDELKAKAFDYDELWDASERLRLLLTILLLRELGLDEALIRKAIRKTKSFWHVWEQKQRDGIWWHSICVAMDHDGGEQATGGLIYGADACLPDAGCFRGRPTH